MAGYLTKFRKISRAFVGYCNTRIMIDFAQAAPLRRPCSVASMSPTRHHRTVTEDDLVVDETNGYWETPNTRVQFKRPCFDNDSEVNRGFIQVRRLLRVVPLWVRRLQLFAK